ncbi:hypothetical protein CC80DRAFT_590316 [Byssothecium circinans]|uniref:Uncharacterized protein n=1 Tax=Byssothecium circinans TaxID=147558 RepID=A0A6A5U8K8_9PLEO|nr:hypothetical protein CC80DRAFT_590316 [Byssothecium circinans]
MPISLDPAKIRRAPPRDVVEHFRAVLHNSTNEAVTIELMEAVESGSLPPTVFAIWFGVSASPTTIKQALGQKMSVLIRFSALKRLAKCLLSRRWKETWDGLGGVSGLLQLFSDLSEREVKEACRTIGYCARGADKEEKRKCIAEFFRALQPRLFAAPHKVSDQRPLQKHFQVLLPACTEDMVSRFIEGGLEGVKSSRRRHFLEHQPAVLQEHALKYVREGHSTGKEWLAPLLLQYPSATTSVKGLSASMLFSLNVLEVLTNQENNPLRGEKFFTELATPLLKRARRKRIGWEITHRIVEWVVECLEKHGGMKELDYERQGFMHLVGQCWAHRPTLFAKSFETLIAGSTKGSKQRMTSGFIRIQHGIRQCRVYALLEFCLKAVGCDLENPEHLKECFGMISYDLLYKLPPRQALDLLTRLRNAKGAENLVGQGPYFDSLLGHIALANDGTGDPGMWRTVLLQRSGYQQAAEDLASKLIQIHKKKAMSGSTPEQRATFAKSVLFYAVASGSLDMYGKELMWARRYVRDPLVATPLWQSHVNETKCLLAGIPETHLLREGLSASQLKERVGSGNRILRELFKTIFTALHEPSFAVHRWHGTLCLPFLVVQERLKRSSELKKTLRFSDDELYEVLWNDTLATLLALEKECLSPGRQRLNFQGLRGILNFQGNSPIPLEKEEPSTYRFLDGLAKARDELWRQFRPTVYPAVTTLPEAFPRGLPIQHLMEPYVLRLLDLESHSPYLALRMKRAVFLDPRVALTPFPDDDESRSAIGPFVDDYSYALHLYVPALLDEAEAKHRTDKAWAHATGPLSHPRLGAQEAIRYWGKTGPADVDFPKHWPQCYQETLATEVWPVVPKVDSLNEIEEWNPQPLARDPEKSHPVEPLTYIDLAKDKTWRAHSPSIHSSSVHYNIQVPGEMSEDLDIWSFNRMQLAHQRPALREGLIIAALLYLDTFNAASTRILSKPFPSDETATVRYPALYLDDSFLATKNLARSNALEPLHAHIRSVPPILLHKVAQNTVGQLNATAPVASDPISLERTAFELVKILAESDRPALAADLAVQCIIDRPEASSWHRQLLSPAYFKRLPASDARACLAAFVDAIIAKVEEQAKAEEEKSRKAETTEERPMESKVDNEKAKPPFLKVTTVKFLAQLLGGAEFVSEEFSLSVLSQLLVKAKHIDIRRAVVSSFLEMLSSPSALSDTVEKILEALKLVIPIAGNLCERQPVTDTDWAKSEETLTPPAIISTVYSGDDTPLLQSLLEFSRLKMSSPQDDHQAAYINRIILPILDSFKQQTTKWINIFLRQQGLTAAEISQAKIPPLPLHQKILEKVLQTSAAYIPLSILDEYITFLNFNIAPPPTIATLNKKLRSSPTLRSTPSVQFYLSRFAAGPTIVTTNPGAGTILATLLNTPAQLQAHITPQHIQQHFLKLLTLLLWHDAPSLSAVTALMGSLWPFDETHKPVERSWAEYHKPIVEAAVMYIEGLRTRDWERDEKRLPMFLPDTWEFRMWLLQYAARYSDALDPVPGERKGKREAEEKEGDDREAHCTAFATRVAKLTDTMAGTLYHRKLERLKRAVLYLRADDRFRVACALGDVKNTRLSWLTMQDLLRVEVAAHLLGQGNVVEDEEVDKRVGEMVESWRVCASEEVRRLGVEAERRREGGRSGFGLFD